MTDWRRLPDAPALRLEGLTVPACALGREGGLVRHSLTLAEGRVVADRPDAVAVDMKGAMTLPCFVDLHTHLDKGQIWPRAPNPDGTFMGALDAVRADHARWTRGDVRARMEFGLRCAFAHGTRAVRTHIDAPPGQDATSFAAFRDAREAWRGRVELQAACLVGAEAVERDGPFRATADIVARSGGVLGMVSYPMPDLRARLDAFLGMAAERGLHADLHVDETLDPASDTLRLVAQAVIDARFDAPVTVGHLCSLSTMPEAEALAILDLVAKAGLHVVSLPMCNLYLQDRVAGRTPRLRGITLVHEMAARGIPVSFASDNARDPFYAYGDLDMLEVLREATRIGHLDHGRDDWALSFAERPARAMGIAPPSLMPGAPADLVLFRARSWTELLARPQADRVVLRGGRAIDRTLPDHSELDHLMEPA